MSHDAISPVDESVVATVSQTTLEVADEAIARAAEALAYYAGAPERHFGRQIPVPGGIDVTFREPIGVVGIIVPWNFPMPIASWGFGPALAAGNCVVLKPAELTPLTAIRIAELCHEAGIPEHVFQVLPGRGSVVGWRFVTHERVGKVCFTGSTEVGKRIMAGCADQVKRVTLELGGKSANIVFADADLERAAASAPASVFDNAGQDCCARSRLLVQRSVYDRFLELLEPAVTAFKVKDPSAEDAEMGPLISAEQRAAVAAYVPEDAPVAFRGSVPEGPGFWFPPTVAVANDTPYGLSGSVWTSDVGRAIRVSRALETGTISVNSHSSVRYWTPFGGFRQSGLGRELGPDALDGFSEVKNVFIATGG